MSLARTRQDLDRLPSKLAKLGDVTTQQASDSFARRFHIGFLAPAVRLPGL